MSPSNLLRSSVLLALLLVPTPAQQPNGPTASAIWGGQNGPPWPINAVVFNQGSFTYQVMGAPNHGYTLVYAPAGLQPGAITTTFGIVDLNLSGGFEVVMDGLFGGTSWMDAFATTGSTGVSTWTIPVSPSLAGPIGSFQTVVGDPTSPTGFRLTAATAVDVEPLAVYVSATTGAPGNVGSRTHPLASIASGVVAALTHSPPWPVVVAVGTYNESPAITNAAGLSVAGGYDPATWMVVPGARSVVNVGGGPAFLANVSACTMSGLEFHAPDQFSFYANSIAVVLGTNTAVGFVNCGFFAGGASNGWTGYDAAPVSPGAAGAPGQNGGFGSTGGSGGAGGSGSTTGGSGGAGGYGSSAGAAGASGAPAGTGEGQGGSGGNAALAFCGQASAGSPGQAGTPGAPAPDPNGGSGLFLTGTSNYLAASSGSISFSNDGGAGGGGGGGGGSPGGLCMPSRGGGGGGGGQGGHGAGIPGQPGGGGGSSIGVLRFSLAYPVPSTFPVVSFTDCAFQTDAGGTGGPGGNGAVGASGGAGGAGGSKGAGNGGNGGHGGAGGAAGPTPPGGGGAGGASAGVLSFGIGLGSFQLLGSNTFTIGSGGAGGLGGHHADGTPAGAVSTGAAGPSGTILVY